MKILLVTDDMHPGGVPRHVVDLANGLQKNGITVSVAATDGNFRKRLHNEVKFIKINLLKKDSFDKNYYGIIICIFRIWSLLLSGKYDIVHSHKRFTHYLVKYLKHKIIHITSYHTCFENKKYQTKYGDYTICVSDSVRLQMISKYGCDSNQIKTIYNGIAPFTVHNDKKKKMTYDRLGISTDNKIIASVGAYIPSKDQSTLIIAVNKLKILNKIHNIKFVFQGYGKQEHELKKLTNSLKLNETIIFVDSMFDVESLFNISEFMILNPIHSEGFGIVMLEAASLGKMHIGTKVGGIPEFIEDGITGKLIEAGNPEQLAQTISFLLDNPNEYKRMGSNAKNKYEKYFGLDRMINETISVYDSVLNKNNYIRSEKDC